MGRSSNNTKKYFTVAHFEEWPIVTFVQFHIVWKINQNVSFQFWYFPPIFVLLKLSCLVTLFDFFVRSKCKRWMRLFLWFSNTVNFVNLHQWQHHLLLMLPFLLTCNWMCMIGSKWFFLDFNKLQLWRHNSNSDLIIDSKLHHFFAFHLTCNDTTWWIRKDIEFQNSAMNLFMIILTIELVPDPPARLSEEERLFSKQKLQKLKMFARLEKVSLPMRHYWNWRFQDKEKLFWFLNFRNRA